MFYLKSRRIFTVVFSKQEANRNLPAEDKLQYDTDDK